MFQYVSAASTLTCMGSDYKTYMKCNGTELSISVKNKYFRAFSIFARFFQLGIPMSSQICFLCATSISRRVGATNNCMQRLEAPSSSVERMLMQTCAPVPINLTRLQSPSYNLIKPPREVIPYFAPSTATRMTFASSTVIELEKAVHSIMCLFDLQMRQLLNPLARWYSGSTWGNQGAKRSTLPKTGCSVLKSFFLPTRESTLGSSSSVVERVILSSTSTPLAEPFSTLPGPGTSSAAS